MQKIKTFLKKIPRHWLTAASGWIGKIIVSLVQIVSIRTLLFYLGEERYAVYIIAYSLFGWFTFAQFSMGQSVQNFISQCRAQNKSFDKYLLASLQICFFLFLICLVFTFLLSNSVQAKLFAKFSNIAEIRQMPIVLAVGIMSLVYAFSSIVYSIYFSLHKGYLPNILPAVSSSISMLLIVIFNRYHLYNSISSALIIFLLPQALLPIPPFIKIFKSFFRKIFLFDMTAVKEVFIRGLKLHGIACMGAAYGMIDYLIMSRTAPPNEIISYNIFMRIFSSAVFMYSALLGAIYPIIAEQFVKKEFSEIKRRLKKYVLYGFALMSACGIGTFIFRDLIVSILAPNIDGIDKSFLFLALIVVCMFIRIIYMACGSFLTSINAVRLLWIVLPVMLILNAAFQYYFSKLWGINGIVIGLALSMLLTVSWILPLKIKKILSEK
ncbi:MAG: MATE family efflux transporter [Elusimicrobiota bacterium]|nr:MATE family efflux transporter [Elusimicrobiota bacterium]